MSFKRSPSERKRIRLRMISGNVCSMDASLTSRYESTVQYLQTAVPIIGSIAAIADGIYFGLVPSAIAAFVALYILTGLSITLGLHRLFTHRSYETYQPIRLGMAIFGSMAGQGT